jgi:hypothetical protein
MRNMIGFTLGVLVVTSGCVSALDEASEPGSQSDVGALSASLTVNCEDRVGELTDFAQRASSETIEAWYLYDDDPNNELVIRYFGQNFDHDRLRARLIKLAQLGRSEHLAFQCEDESTDACADPENILWSTPDEWKNGDWRIHVCGGRFWEDRWVNGQDSGNGASQVGIMVHEISHLTGAYSDADTRNEAGVIAAASDPIGSYLMPDEAEAYRFYVMNVHF